MWTYLQTNKMEREYVKKTLMSIISWNPYKASSFLNFAGVPYEVLIYDNGSLKSIWKSEQYREIYYLTTNYK